VRSNEPLEVYPDLLKTNDASPIQKALTQFLNDADQAVSFVGDQNPKWTGRRPPKASNDIVDQGGIKGAS
jgi:hypothetical protein